MVCLACTELSQALLCEACRQLIRPGPPRRLRGGFIVYPGAFHAGPARALVHRLKYQGVRGAAKVLAIAMSQLVPAETTALVAVPRAVSRRVRYGTDPAALLAQALGSLLGIEVVDAIRPGLWWPHHAGRTNPRARPRFALTVAPQSDWVLVDDVLTSGATMTAAFDACERVLRLGVTATGAGTVV